VTATDAGVHVRSSDGAAWLVLDRPDALNALDLATKEALLAALEAASTDDSVRAVALTGRGRAFCVGEDLRELRGAYQSGRAPELGETLERHYAPIVQLLADMPKPTVALVNGIAAGAGL
jgi:2-(1,2-epoxy-1,2-dihydrophenyl)acetyl-CoA isomerase